MHPSLIALLAATALMSGCASIVGGNNQSLSVVAKTPDNRDVTGATCSLSNDKGQWYATTPGSVTVRRSYNDMAVTCQHPTSVGVAQIKSATKAMAFGNVIFGGLIGVGVDVASGAAYDYPDLIAVQMLATEPVRPEGAVTMPVAVAAAIGASVAAPMQPAISQVAPQMTGEQSLAAERLANFVNCAGPPPRLTAKSLGIETYIVPCYGGSEVLSIRCEKGTCRVLQ